MRIIEDKIEGDTRLEKDTELRGMLVGNVTVAPGVTVELRGMIVGKLELEPLSSVYLRGMVTGDVVNRGGRLEIWGMVKGRITRQDGVSVVHPGGIVSETS